MPEVAVSIIIPTYNRKEYLKKALESISRQTYDHSQIEVLIIDDFSTDGTEEMVREFSAKSDSSVRYYKNDKKGQTMARNKGFKLASGEIVVSTDSDVEADPDWIRIGIRYFDDETVAALEGRIIQRGTIGPFIHALSNEKGGTYQTANMFYRNDILKKAGWLDENLNKWWNFGSDYDLALRIMEAGGRIVFAGDSFIYHPVYKLKVKAMLKNSLKSGAIPYLYKKHKDKLPWHLKMSYRRAFTAVFVMGFLVSICWLSYTGILISLAGVIVLVNSSIPWCNKAGLGIKIKAVLIYGLGATINLLAFLYSCLRLKVFPVKKMFRV